MLKRSIRSIAQQLLASPSVPLSFAVATGCAVFGFYCAASVLLGHFRHPVFPLYYVSAEAAIFVWAAVFTAVSVVRGFRRRGERRSDDRRFWRDPVLWCGVIVFAAFLVADHVYALQRERDLPIQLRLQHALSKARKPSN